MLIARARVCIACGLWMLAVSACSGAAPALVDQVLSVVHARWASLLIAQGELESAQEHAEHAVELDLGSADAHFKLGLACVLLEQNERGIVELEVALQLDPQHLEARRKLAEAYLAIGRTRSAREHASLLRAHESGCR